MMRRRARIESLLRDVFAQLRERTEPEYGEKRDEFVFHMTDWLEDLDALTALYRADETSKEEAARFIVSFLCHVTPHLSAAGRLLLDEIPDPFLKTAEKKSSD